MSALARGALIPRSAADDALVGEVLAHLEVQLVEVRRLLAIVLDQGAAICRRDVHEVVRLAGLLQAELERRAVLESQRLALLERAGNRFGIAHTAVTLSLLTSVMEPAEAELALARSAELRGMLFEVQREHACNRALMSQELSFLDHLLSLTGEGAAGYGSRGHRAPHLSLVAGGRQRVLDLEV